MRWEYIGIESDANGNNVNIWPSLINLVNIPVSQGGTLGTTAATGSLAGFVVPSNFNYSIYPAPPVGGLFQSNHEIPPQNSPSKTNFAPRVGFAWKPLAYSDRFVVRGGGGLFYDRIGSNQYDKGSIQIPPYWFRCFSPALQTISPLLLSPMCRPSLGWQTLGGHNYCNFGQSSNINDLLMASQLSHPAYLSMEPQHSVRVPAAVGARAGLRGNPRHPPNARQSRFLDAGAPLNEALLATAANPVNGITTNTTSNASLRVPYLGFAPGGLEADQTISVAKYNSMQATVRRQFSHGFTMQAAYTWSRGVDTGATLPSTIPTSR